MSIQPRGGAVPLLTLVLLVAAPAIAWATFKPARILAPSLNGVKCAGRVCVDDPTQLSRAAALQPDAFAAVGRTLLPLDRPPLTAFFSTPALYRSLGGGTERG